MGMRKIVKQIRKVDVENWTKTIIFKKWLIVTPN